MLKTLEQMMPEEFNFSQLAEIFEKNQSQPVSTTELNYKILKYFCRVLSENSINIKTYQLLQEQAQKLEATIRSHIKVEQEMKMYLDYLESKINSYQKDMSRNHDSPMSNLNNQEQLNEIEMLKSKQSILMKEKIALLRKNQQLNR